MVGMDVIGLGKPREQDQDRAQQRKRHLARRNRSRMLAIHQRKLTRTKLYNYNARTLGNLMPPGHDPVAQPCGVGYLDASRTEMLPRKE